MDGGKHTYGSVQVFEFLDMEIFESLLIRLTYSCQAFSVLTSHISFVAA